jgi:Fur family ferric uptake transcriptional regulator
MGRQPNALAQRPCPGSTDLEYQPSARSGASCRMTTSTVNSDAVPLKRAGLKATSPRMHVLEAFRTSNRRHLSAEDVYRILLDHEVDAGLSTVYRVLNQLVQANILLRHSFESDHAVFELNEGGHHDHLICVGCGVVEEFKDEGIEARQKQVAAQNDFVLREHMLVLYGLCPVCQQGQAG